MINTFKIIYLESLDLKKVFCFPSVKATLLLKNIIPIINKQFFIKLHLKYTHYININLNRKYIILSDSIVFHFHGRYFILFNGYVINFRHFKPFNFELRMLIFTINHLKLGKLNKKIYISNSSY